MLAEKSASMRDNRVPACCEAVVRRARRERLQKQSTKANSSRTEGVLYRTGTMNSKKLSKPLTERYLVYIDEGVPRHNTGTQEGRKEGKHENDTPIEQDHKMEPTPGKTPTNPLTRRSKNYPVAQPTSEISRKTKHKVNQRG